MITKERACTHFGEREGRNVVKKSKTLSFRTRVLLGLLAVAFVSLAFFFAGSVYFAVRMAEKNYARTVTGPMETQSEQLDDAMRGAYRTAVHAANDRELRCAVTAYSILSAPAVEDSFELYERLLELQRESQDASSLSIYLYDQNQMITSSEFRVVSDVPPETAPTWVTAAPPSDFSPHIYWDDAGGVPRCQFCYFHDVQDSYGKVTARVCVNLEERTLYYDLFRQSVGSDSTIYLVGADGLVVSADDAGNYGMTFEDLTGQPVPRARTSFGTTGSGKLYAFVQGNFSGISVLRLTSRASLSDEIAGMALLLLLMMFCVGGAAVLFARSLSNWLYRPLDALMRAMERAGQGDMTARAPVGEDEFGAIGGQFNQMMEKIDTLLDDLVEVRVKKRQAEIEALQQQIKPHFMYNTLNSIKFAAILQGNNEIGDLLTSFIELLEASISKKGAFIPLSDEIHLVEDYAALQKYRYMDSFTLTCTVEPEAAGCMVPRLLLQPFVENAILHGIIPRRPDNRIAVDARVADGELHLTVSDNGKGMSEAECRALLENDPEDSRRFTGIGMRNVRERLRLYYGDAASFSVQTAPGAGTRFTLTLPRRPEGGTGNEK